MEKGVRFRDPHQFPLRWTTPMVLSNVKGVPVFGTRLNQKEACQAKGSRKKKKWRALLRGSLIHPKEL